MISNAADALEKLRHAQSVENLESEKPLEIRITLDQDKRQFIIQDYGIGMTLEELNENLGTIAKSGSKSFLEKLEKEGGSSSRENIIGQFGVGFYSTVSYLCIHIYIDRMCVCIRFFISKIIETCINLYNLYICIYLILISLW